MTLGLAGRTLASPVGLVFLKFILTRSVRFVRRGAEGLALTI
tara:strand:- start:13279 stop:13404 length:126 start_codon:yes stop_codon:yes gene_type:complete